MHRICNQTYNQNCNQSYNRNYNQSYNHNCSQIHSKYSTNSIGNKINSIE